MVGGIFSVTDVEETPGKPIREGMEEDFPVFFDKGVGNPGIGLHDLVTVAIDRHKVFYKQGVGHMQGHGRGNSLTVVDALYHEDLLYVHLYKNEGRDGKDHNEKGHGHKKTGLQ